MSTINSIFELTAAKSFNKNFWLPCPQRVEGNPAGIFINIFSQGPGSLLIFHIFYRNSPQVKAAQQPLT